MTQAVPTRLSLRLSPPREPPSPKRGRDDVAPSSQNFDSVFRQASIVLAMRLHPSHSADALRKKSEGARDAGVRRTHGLRHLAKPEAERRSRPRLPSCMLSNRKSAFSPASRARCLRLSSAWPPVAEWFLPTALDLLQRLAVWHGVTAPPPRSPVTRTCGAGTDAASAAARWVCVLHPCAATASRSRLMTPHEAPSDGPAWAQYESGKSARG